MDAWLRDVMQEMPRLRAQAVLLTRSPVEAEDVVQETLARAWRFRNTFRPGTDRRAWLFRILRNVHLGGLARPPLVGDADDGHAGNLRTEPDQEWRVQVQDLMVALAELNGETRQALLMVAGCGFTYEEAADACGCSAGTVKSRVSRGRERLVRVFQEQELSPSRSGRRRRLARLAG